MHGKLVALFVAEGEVVEKGQRVAIVEAMKMEHPVLAPRAGRVEGIAFEPGQQMGQAPASSLSRRREAWRFTSSNSASAANSIADLESWIEDNRLLHQRLKRPYRQFHTTRMIPKRMDEILGGGSLYWVIKGFLSARQRIEAIEPFTDTDGIQRCHLVLEPVVIRCAHGPCGLSRAGDTHREGCATRPSQQGTELAEMPESLQRELRALGLL